MFIVARGVRKEIVVGFGCRMGTYGSETARRACQRRRPSMAESILVDSIPVDSN